MSENEDVEIARCIRNYVGINCTNAYEVREQNPMCSKNDIYCCIQAIAHSYCTHTPFR